MTRSRKWQQQTNATGGEQGAVILLEICHPMLEAPVRIIGDTQDLVSNGNTYTACAFQLTLPDDVDQRYPRAQLSIDNIGEELTQWLEASGGGDGATCRIMQVLREDPNHLEADITLDMTSLHLDHLVVTADLGFEDVLDLPAVAVAYRPEITPELF